MTVRELIEKLEALPAGGYILRKKEDDPGGTWDVQVESDDCEAGFTMLLPEAIEALAKRAEQIKRGEP